MYLLTWNSTHQQIEACFGGRVSDGEAAHFSEEIGTMLRERSGQAFTVVVDYSTASSLDESVPDLFEAVREACRLMNVQKVTFITRDSIEAGLLTEARLEHVLEGREEYSAHRQAA